MATQLKNTLSFTDLAAGASLVLPHELNNGAIPVEPDIVFVPSGDLTVTTDEINVTLTNTGASPLSGAVLVEYWHTVERAFGPAADENLSVKPYVVVSPEGAGQPPNPGFISRTTRTIYARLTGSDTTGSGTLASPYRTFQRAMQDVPTVIYPWIQYIVDITGLGLETLPGGYTLPPTVSAQYYDFDFAAPYFPFVCALNINADPQLVASISEADATVDAADIASVTSDPNTSLVTINLNVARASWAGDALKGKMVVGAGGGFDTGVIVSSTNTSIELSKVAAPTNPFTIREPSAILQSEAPPAEAFFRGSVTSMGNPSIHFGGIGFLEPVGGGFPGLYITVTETTCFFYLCDIDSLIWEQGSCRVNQSYLHATSYGSAFSGYAAFFFGGLVADSVAFALQTMQVFFARFQYFDGVGLYFLDRTELAPASIQGGTMIRCEIRNSPGDGMRFAGAQLFMQFVNIENFADNGISANGGQGLLTLESVQGAGAVGSDYGIQVNDGMAVRMDPSTTISGATNDQKVGDLAAGAYPANPFSINDYTYDPTLGASAQVTGTGSRLFDPTP